MKASAKDSNKLKPLVSVIIPTYNRKSLLVEAVASCFSQTWDRLEILIIDDGSTDGTDALASQNLVGPWAEGVKYTKQNNKGASSARNVGLKLADGEYIQFLDSDDILYPAKIAEQISLLELPENRSAACCCCYGNMGPSPSVEPPALLEQIGYGTTDPRELVRELCSRRVHGMQSSAPLWRRCFLMAHSGWREDIALGDDLEYHIRLLVDASKICFIGKTLFFVREHCGYRLSADGISAASLSSLIRTRHAIFESLQKSALWDAQTQRAFLDAMRTIYANSLHLGDHECIRNLEDWLWELAIAPRPLRKFQALILLRRILGRQFLVRTHKLIKKFALL